MGQSAVNRTGRNKRKPSSIPPELKHVNINAAGIDIGSEVHYVAVPPGRDPDGQDVRHFGAFTGDLCALADWLQCCHVRSVAMESTGVFWIPLFELLEQRGFEVQLVNPRHLKNVPGRKTDVLDCQWLQQLHTYGLLRGSFRPAAEICVLRSYLRQREMLVQYRSHHIQHMQKALDQMNLKLHKVISHISGVTGMSIVRAIVDGERDPKRLAQLRNARCQKSELEIAQALHGTWHEEHLFALRQAVELFDAYSQKIADCDARLEAAFGALEDRSKGAEPPKPLRRPGTNTSAPDFDAHGLLYRATGVDLTRLDGIAETTALTLVTEVGLDVTAWRSEKHFASWLGLCPGSKVSGGKRLSGRTKPCANRAATALRVAAQSLYHSHSALGAYYRRLSARLGAAKAITATAHKLARLIYRMLRYGTDYVDVGQDHYEQRYRERVLKGLERRARELGYNLSKIHDLAAVGSAT